MKRTAYFNRLTFFLLVLAGGLTLARPASADDRVVGDGTPGSCTEAAFDTALAAVQASQDGEVSFNCGGPATIIFTSQKTIDSQLVVIHGGDQITLSGANNTRLFRVVAGALELRHIKLAYGFSGNGYGGAILAENNAQVYLINSEIRDSQTALGYGGGAILSLNPITNSFPTVLIEDSVISGNTSTYAAVNTIGKLVVQRSTFYGNTGGGLSVAGSVEIVDSHFIGNEAVLGGAIRMGTGTLEMTGGSLYSNQAGNGGAIYNAGNVVLTNVDVRNNYAFAYLGGQGHGGAIYNTDYVFLEGVTVSHNFAYVGGAAYNMNSSGAMLVGTNSTFSVNRAPFASEVYNGGGLEFENATLVGDYDSNNTSMIWNADLLSTALRFRSTLVQAHNSQSSTICVGKKATSSDFSFYNNGTCLWQSGSGNIISSRHVVDEETDNGGPTQTYLPFEGSAVIDAGQCDQDVDQRGVPRPQGPACDIGSVERRTDESEPDLQFFIPIIHGQ